MHTEKIKLTINTKCGKTVLQFWRQVYLLTILSLILAVFCAQVHPNYLNNDWRRIRMTIFCCVAGISVIPACHWVWLNDGFATEVVQVKRRSITSFENSERVLIFVTHSETDCAQLFLPRVIVMYLIAGSAFLFYVTKIPERCFPGESASPDCVWNCRRKRSSSE